MRALGVDTYGYIWSTRAEDCVRRLGELGFAELELVLNPPHLSLEEGPAARASLRRAAAAAGVQLRALNLPSLDVNLASPMPRATPPRAARVPLIALSYQYELINVLALSRRAGTCSPRCDRITFPGAHGSNPWRSVPP